MADDEPWWAPIRKAIVSKIADVIEKMPIQDLERILDADWEDLPAKAPRTRRKALPARPPQESDSQVREAEK